MLTGVLCDGLGHGPLAARAAQEAVAAVLEDPAAEPAALVERAHRRLPHTRGGAIGVVQVTGPVVRFAGLGNIAAAILAGGTRKSMISVPGSSATRPVPSVSSSTPRRPARRSSCTRTASARAGMPPRCRG